MSQADGDIRLLGGSVVCLKTAVYLTITALNGAHHPHGRTQSGHACLQAAAVAAR
jgi:hypothetical protein